MKINGKVNLNSIPPSARHSSASTPSRRRALTYGCFRPRLCENAKRDSRTCDVFDLMTRKRKELNVQPPGSHCIERASRRSRVFTRPRPKADISAAHKPQAPALRCAQRTYLCAVSHGMAACARLLRSGRGRTDCYTGAEGTTCPVAHARRGLFFVGGRVPVVAPAAC